MKRPRSVRCVRSIRLPQRIRPSTTPRAELGPQTSATSATADLIDSVLASSTKSGYAFVFTGTGGGLPNTGYTVTAAPTAPGTSGQSTFYTDQSAVIRKNPTGTANSGSAPLQ